MKRVSSLLVALSMVTGLLVASNVFAQKKRMRTYHAAVQGKLNGMMKPGWKCKVNLGDSKDGDGQDLEIRLTMPINKYMEFAPVAALEAASIPHKFPVVHIYLREETTDRIARVKFKDAEPIAGRYLAGDKNAVNEMKNALIWH